MKMFLCLGKIGNPLNFAGPFKMVFGIKYSV